MGFTASTTQAFQYSLPYEQVFNQRPLHHVRDALQLHLLR